MSLARVSLALVGLTFVINTAVTLWLYAQAGTLFTFVCFAICFVLMVFGLRRVARDWKYT